MMTAKVGADASSLIVVRDEVSRVLTAVAPEQVVKARELFAPRSRRWFCCGQGRSGLVAQMVAMRLMHAGFDVHAVGEPTAPAIGDGDGLLALSGSGETPMTLHFTRLARSVGVHVLAVTTQTDSTLAALAQSTLVLPTAGTSQFGGTLFEQTSLLALDALVLDLTSGESGAFDSMQARHSNLQ
jgi:6-phospho-3-hexuloisomerase